jgi:hypothetical protein
MVLKRKALTRADLEPVADEMVDALLAHIGRDGGLEDEMLDGSWVIALIADGPHAEALRRAVLARSAADEDTPLLRRILHDSQELDEDMQRGQGRRLMTLILAAPEDVVSVFQELSTLVAERMIEGLSEVLTARAGTLLAKQDGDETEEAYERRSRN